MENQTYRAMAEAHPQAYFTVGTHPHNAAEEPDIAVETLASLSLHPRCIAIGEAGLDYHYDTSPREVQRKVFLRISLLPARQGCLSSSTRATPTRKWRKS